MKFIFDFDDVLFYTTKHRLGHWYPFLEKLGISYKEIDEYYKKGRAEKFSLKKVLAHFSLQEESYEEIMRDAKSFLNEELVNIVKTIGKENCYIITYGEKEFQLDKIKRTGIGSLFSEIIVVSIDEKQDILEEICTRHKDEKIVFIDDKVKHLEDIDFKKCPNLKTILYDEQGLNKLKAEINKI